MTNHTRKRPRSSAEWLYLDSYLTHKVAQGMAQDHADKIRLAWRNREGNTTTLLQTVGLLSDYQHWWLKNAIEGIRPWEKNSVESES